MPRHAQVSNELKKQVGDRWKRIRISHCLQTQLELAESLDVDEATVNRIEAGRSFPSFETIEAMAAHTGYTALELTSDYSKEDLRLLAYLRKEDVLLRAFGNEIKNMLEAQASDELKWQIYGSNRFDVLLKHLLEGFDKDEVDDFSKKVAQVLAKAVYGGLNFDEIDEVDENES